LRFEPLALLCASCLVACGGGGLSLGQGESQFGDGRYPAAKQTFALLEPRFAGWDEVTRAEYCVYRGLTYEALGDFARAGEWLRRAKAMEDERPGTLPADNAERLRVALASVDLAR
jgi:hypothetical protein